MHLQIVNFRLKDLSEEEYRAGCEQDASAFATVSGLISKVWLADPASNTYGGIYTWRDRVAMEAYVQSDLFKALASDPHLADLTSQDFGVLEGPTGVTRGLPEAAAV